MRIFILGFCMTLLAGAVQAQNRKQLANFSQFKHYYNPSLTGYEGPLLRSAYRNQWTGFEDAPKTVLLSAELDLQRVGRDSNRPFANGQDSRDRTEDISARHGLGLTLFHDQFGPAREMQVNLGYGSAVRLSERVSLRWGAALTYTSHRLDGNSLTVDQESDPRYSGLLGQKNNSGRGDLNLGISLTSQNLYVGYALIDVTEGSLLATGSDYLSDFYARRHVGQAGYRVGVTDMAGIILNGIYQYDSYNKSTVEGQLKAVYNNAFWVAGGYRNNLAYTLGAGVRLKQLSVGYTYESPTQDAKAIDKSTNEITLSYRLMPFASSNSKRGRQRVLIW
ncbi:PorP/SprF family type IX secretion system membrane protein [Pontibacter mangrovi]|uniref:Type IX secretion system membrane protein PorP/SprF n=1 Tax=Pontibacter mangrovi TaxID=2589816 RepID=A0A501W357_9BACT|nr:PorP/SprF family type IX secretion system membrane protein [Pontibacter mangrovi]TPE43065.1 type IX secretion system membrane protein PorP/SprF [Pontibacter mangrovi]